MHIVITGRSSQINEWAVQCAEHGHTIYAAFVETDEPLNQHVAAFSDEVAPIIELIVDLNLEDLSQKASRLDTLCVMTRRHIPMLSNTLLVTATELARQVKYPELLTGMAYLPTFLNASAVEIAVPHESEKGSLAVIEEFVASIGKTSVLVDDYPGMVFPRIIATIVNEAMFTLQHKVADAEAIDTAMRLGVNYPDGPMEWGKRLGYVNLLKLLETLHTEYGDDRYRPAPYLKKLV